MKNQLVLKNTKDVPEATIRRLPVYHHYLKQLENDGVVSVSCTQIANWLDFNPIQVRKDIEFTCVEGKPKIGYELKDLIAHIEEFLCFHIKNEAVLIGAGHLGYALLGYHGFKEFGLEIVAAFDNSQDKVDKFINYKKVFSIDKLEEIITRMKIKIGILTVPASCAQALADRMVAAGIKAIWNFAPIKINVPKDVVVQHENLASSLAVLSKKIDENIKRDLK
ncbi:MAG: redox-sensing transcriptional repressor Rex [Endomicrobiaceae bacterium]|nr:redox-sensing transcriptional repressor Rex [Endomicrobiaceae bacterium]